MFHNFVGLVTSPEFVVESCDLALVFGELNDFTSVELQSAMEDVFNFHVEMLMGLVSPL